MDTPHYPLGGGGLLHLPTRWMGCSLLAPVLLLRSTCLPAINMAALASRASLSVRASSAKDAPRTARVVPKASLSGSSSAPKQFRETGAEAPAPTAAPAISTPFDGYKFAPIREATVGCVPVCASSVVLLCG
jgi:hypothetical protein